MIVDGTNFIESEVKKMAKVDFIRMHMDVIWLDKSSKDRGKCLSDVYDRITEQKEDSFGND